MKLLAGYLRSLGLDFHDLQDALDQIEGKTPKRLELADKLLTEGLEKLSDDPEFCRRVSSSLGKEVAPRLEELERRLRQLEDPAGTESDDD
jgi:hypothetical protein